MPDAVCAPPLPGKVLGATPEESPTHLLPKFRSVIQKGSLCRGYSINSRVDVIARLLGLVYSPIDQSQTLRSIVIAILIESAFLDYGETLD